MRIPFTAKDHFTSYVWNFQVGITRNFYSNPAKPWQNPWVLLGKFLQNYQNHPIVILFEY
jgi:hypothetical protein